MKQFLIHNHNLILSVLGIILTIGSIIILFVYKYFTYDFKVQLEKKVMKLYTMPVTNKAKYRIRFQKDYSKYWKTEINLIRRVFSIMAILTITCAALTFYIIFILPRIA